MTVEHLQLRTVSGDTITATLFDFTGQEPSVCITLTDGEETPGGPAAEMTIAELGQLRELLRRLGEMAERSRWTTRR